MSFAVIDRTGAIAVDATTSTTLAAAAGKYRVHRSGSLVVMTLDEGTGAVARDGEVLAVCGDIAAMPLLGLMNTFGQNRETGRVVLKRGSAERVVLLSNGDVASIGSNLPSDRLGVFLVRLGKISESALESAMTEAQRSGKRMGQVLLQKGLLDSHQLWRAIQEQITDLFADVMQWDTGSFTLYRVAPGFQMPPTPPMPMQGLLLEAVRRADEMSLFRERIPSTAARLRRTDKAPSPSMASDAETALAAQAHAALVSEASVTDIAKALHVSDFDATRACYELLKRGLAELVRQKADSHYRLRPGDKSKIEVFNVAFKEIHDEVSRSGQRALYMQGVQKYLDDTTHAYHALFRGLRLDDHGALPLDTLALNVSAIVAEGHDAATAIAEALQELTFFMLFQCSSFLKPDVDEQLGRRVRLIHGSLRS